MSSADVKIGDETLTVEALKGFGRVVYLVPGMSTSSISRGRHLLQVNPIA